MLFLYTNPWHHVGSIISVESPPTHADVGCDLMSWDQALYLVDFAGSIRITSSSLCPSLPTSTSHISLSNVFQVTLQCLPKLTAPFLVEGNKTLHLLSSPVRLKFLPTGTLT